MNVVEKKESEAEGKEISFGKVFDLVSSVEQAIRFLLTGITLWAIAAGGQTDPKGLFKWMQERQAIAAVPIISTGFVSFSFYRLMFWVVGDQIAWRAGQSVPSLFGRRGWTYDLQYTKFLEWRHSGKLASSLGGYLTYRWSVAHYSVITSIALFLAPHFAEDASLIATNDCWALRVAAVALIFGVWQQSFLFRVERNLCQRNGHPEV